MRFAIATLSAAVILGCSILGAATAGDSTGKKPAPHWTKSAGGCGIWNAFPVPAGTNEHVTWSGPCVKGKAHGRGRLVWYMEGLVTTDSHSVLMRRGKIAAGYTDMSFYNGGKYDGRYRGQFRNGDFNGRGRYDYADGAHYVGQWKDGQIHGRGTFTWQEGDRYTGQWKDGKEHGKGFQRLASGDTYRGDFVNGKRHGYGVYVDRNAKGMAATYKGQFEDDALNGFAEKVQGRGSPYTGQKYIGYFKNWKVHGSGTATALDGSFFTGEYRDGQRWADRRYLARHGKIWTWKDGKQIEPGTPYKK